MLEIRYIKYAILGQMSFSFLGQSYLHMSLFFTKAVKIS